MSIALANPRIFCPALAVQPRLQPPPVTTAFTLVEAAPGDFSSDFGPDFSGGSQPPAGGDFGQDFGPDFSGGTPPPAGGDFGPDFNSDFSKP